MAHLESQAPAWLSLQPPLLEPPLLEPPLESLLEPPLLESPVPARPSLVPPLVIPLSPRLTPTPTPTPTPVPMDQRAAASSTPSLLLLESNSDHYTIVLPAFGGGGDDSTDSHSTVSQLTESPTLLLLLESSSSSFQKSAKISSIYTRKKKSRSKKSKKKSSKSKHRRTAVKVKPIAEVEDHENDKHDREDREDSCATDKDLAKTTTPTRKSSKRVDNAAAAIGSIKPSSKRSSLSGTSKRNKQQQQQQQRPDLDTATSSKSSSKSSPKNKSPTIGKRTSSKKRLLLVEADMTVVELKRLPPTITGSRPTSKQECYNKLPLFQKQSSKKRLAIVPHRKESKRLDDKATDHELHNSDCKENGTTPPTTARPVLLREKSYKRNMMTSKEIPAKQAYSGGSSSSSGKLLCEEDQPKRKLSKRVLVSDDEDEDDHGNHAAAASPKRKTSKRSEVEHHEDDMPWPKRKSSKRLLVADDEDEDEDEDHENRVPQSPKRKTSKKTASSKFITAEPVVGPIQRQSDRSLMEANIDALVRKSKQTIKQEIDALLQKSKRDVEAQIDALLQQSASSLLPSTKKQPSSFRSKTSRPRDIPLDGTITHTGTRADGRMPVNVNEEDLLSTPRASNRTKLSLAVSPSTRRQLETLEFSIDQEENRRVYAVVEKYPSPAVTAVSPSSTQPGRSIRRPKFKSLVKRVASINRFFGGKKKPRGDVEEGPVEIIFEPEEAVGSKRQDMTKESSSRREKAMLKREPSATKVSFCDDINAIVPTLPLATSSFKRKHSKSVFTRSSSEAKIKVRKSALRRKASNRKSMIKKSSSSKKLLPLEFEIDQNSEESSKDNTLSDRESSKRTQIKRSYSL